MVILIISKLQFILSADCSLKLLKKIVFHVSVCSIAHLGENIDFFESFSDWIFKSRLSGSTLLADRLKLHIREGKSDFTFTESRVFADFAFGGTSISAAWRHRVEAG